MIRSQKNRGFTVAEMVLALAIVGMIGLSVTGVYMTLNTAQAHSDEYYTHLQTARGLVRTLDRSLRKARLVLARDADGIAVWTDDTDDDGLVNLSEITVFYYSSSDGTVVRSRVVFPDEMAETVRAPLDEQITLAEISTVTGLRTSMAEKSPSYFTDVLLAENVLSFTSEVDSSAPLSTLVKASFAVGTAKRYAWGYAGGALRAPYVSRVGQVDGDYVLTVPAAE